MANPAVAIPAPDSLVESRPEPSAPSSDNLNPSQPEDNSNATPAVLPQTSAPAVDRPADSILEAAIDSSVEDTTAPSTVPPVVVLQESDVRDAPLPTQEAPAKAEPEQSSASLDSHTNGVLPAPTETPENTSAADLTSTSDPTLSQLAIKEDVPSQASTAEHPDKMSPDLNTDVDMHGEPALPTTSAVEQHDAEMADASPTSTKVAREREDDMEVEPSAKRAKTDDEAEPQDRAGPETPATPVNGEAAPVKPDSNPITPYEAKEIIKVLKNVLRTNDGKNFRAPVSTLWPQFAESYYAKVPNPIDLSNVETKVRESKYPTWGDFRADMQLIADNALLFNGENHPITKAGESVRSSVYNKTAIIPAEPVAAPKPIRKQAKRSTPQAESTPRAASARRPSRSAGTAAAAPAATGTPSQTFALDPSTSTPLIRRDSTKNEGGRPKREIHPPKNKDLPYSVRPKARKYAAEMKFCEDTLNEMKKPKHAAFASAFYVPVDPVALNIPHYFTAIKNPMDLSTVAKKLQTGAYQRAKDFEADVRLIFSNCYKFNPEGNPVHEMGKQLEAVFEEKWAQKHLWIADNAPAAQSPSQSGSDEEESDDGEETEQAAQSSAATAALAQRLIEEQTKLITLMQAKNPDQGLIQMQQDMVALVQSRIQENAKSTAPGKKAPKKPKAPKGAKKPAPKKAAGGPGKKGAASRQRYLGTLEKETISAGLASLPDEVAESVLEMIKNDKPDVDVSLAPQLTHYLC